MKKFKKGDYIVILKTPFSHDPNFPINHVYKQRAEHDYFLSYLDMKGSLKNGWEWINANEHEGERWRYATVDEAELYEAAGKPCRLEDYQFKLDELLDKLDQRIMQMEENQPQLKIGDKVRVISLPEPFDSHSRFQAAINQEGLITNIYSYQKSENDSERNIYHLDNNRWFVNFQRENLDLIREVS